MLETMTAWLYAVMLSIAPPQEHAYAKKETTAQTEERYRSIARDVASVALEDDPVFKGARAREQTALLMLSVAWFESGHFRRDVDTGEARGDSGRSWCLMQLHIGQGTTIYGPDARRGWYGKDLVEDRRKCFQAGLEAIRSSFTVCRNLPKKDKLALFVSGRCEEDIKEGQHRMGMSQYLWTKYGKELSKGDIN